MGMLDGVDIIKEVLYPQFHTLQKMLSETHLFQSVTYGCLAKQRDALY